MLDDLMASGGRPRQLSSRTVLLALKVAVVGNGECHVATSRQYEDTFSVMCRSIDPSPVPSFRGVPENERAGYLEEARAGIDVASRSAALRQVADRLVEQSVPDEYKSASRSLAVDWTDHETWSRPRAKDDEQPANDPDGSWGHWRLFVELNPWGWDPYPRVVEAEGPCWAGGDWQEEDVAACG